MSYYCYDYLADSLLFTDNFLNGRISSIEEVVPVLDEYRIHCFQCHEQVFQEISRASPNGIKSLERPFGRLSEKINSSNLMSQAILKDAVIVRDPLLSLCSRIRNRTDNEVFSKWMRLNGPDYLNDLIVTCRYLKAMTPFVVHGFLRFFPDVSGLDDSGIPIYYSPTAVAA